MSALFIGKLVRVFVRHDDGVEIEDVQIVDFCTDGTVVVRQDKPRGEVFEVAAHEVL